MGSKTKGLCDLDGEVGGLGGLGWGGGGGVEGMSNCACHTEKKKIQYCGIWDNMALRSKRNK